MMTVLVNDISYYSSPGFFVCILKYLFIRHEIFLSQNKSREIIRQDIDLSIYISMLFLPFSDF